MEITIDNYSIAPIHQKDAWRLCDFVVVNQKHLKDYFPETLRENLTPTLSELFVRKKQMQFDQKEEFLFTVKENTNRSIIGLICVKELFKNIGQGELAYCIGCQYAGKGLMTKFIKEIIAWSFDKAMLSRLQIIVHESNLASIRIAEKLNFKFIGALPNEHKMSDGRLVAMKLYEKGKTDYVKPK